jgi:hypothetical protein
MLSVSFFFLAPWVLDAVQCCLGDSLPFCVTFSHLLPLLTSPSLYPSLFLSLSRAFATSFPRTHTHTHTHTHTYYRGPSERSWPCKHGTVCVCACTTHVYILVLTHATSESPSPSFSLSPCVSLTSMQICVCVCVCVCVLGGWTCTQLPRCMHTSLKHTHTHTHTHHAWYIFDDTLI